MVRIAAGRYGLAMVGIIGGQDGPTAVFISGGGAPLILTLAAAALLAAAAICFFWQHRGK